MLKKDNPLPSIHDHKNLTYKNFNTERVMHWRLLIEEFGADLTYIKGEDNIIADALSRLELIPDKQQESFHHGTLLQLLTNDTVKDITENRNTVALCCSTCIKIED